MRSDRTVYLGVLAPLVLAIALLAGLSIVGFDALSAARAYTAGESLWSKARSSAVEQLRTYALTGRPLHHQQFVAALAINLGDRQARETLDQPSPDRQRARDGFLRGANAADDIDGMIRLYRWSSGIGFMQQATAAWAEGDRLIAELQALGARIDAQVQADRAAPAMAGLLDELDRLEDGLGAAGQRFSDTLGRASRATTSLLIATTATLALLLAGGAAWFVCRALRQHLDDRQALLEANRRWEMAAAADGIGVIDWQIDADRFRLDARACALYGIDPARADGVSRNDLRAQVHPDDQADGRRALDAALHNGAPFKTRFRVVHTDATPRHLEVTALVSGAAQRPHARMVGIVRDVSAEVSSAQLQLEKEAAERTARSRLVFLSRLSHELRTPLNAILGMAQLLLMDQATPLPPAQRKRVQIVLDSGQQQLRLVEDVLDLTRIDAGLPALETQRCDLRALLHAALAIVEPLRAAFDVVVDDQLPDPVPAVHGDAQRLQQVFVNLLGNACRFNRRGGTLTLACEATPAQLCVQVRDQGRGLTAEEVSALFQPFERLAGPATGTGLGLVVVKMLVEQMGGRVAVDSEPGSGSCFTVCLPLA